MYSKTPLHAAILAAAFLGLGACAGTGPLAHKPAVTDSQFAAGWQEHVHPLYNRGRGLAPGTTDWWVPTILPRGNYVVIVRNGKGAELVDGYGFDVDHNVWRDIHLMLPAGYHDVEALEEKYVKDVMPLGH